jgi:antitoxin FitA
MPPLRIWRETWRNRLLSLLSPTTVIACPLSTLLRWIMAQVIIRNIEDEVVERLKQVAATKGTSLEQELRSILADAAYRPNRVLTELAQLRSLTPPGTRPLAEDLVREGREER